jgi:hypothetical protein
MTHTGPAGTARPEEVAPHWRDWQGKVATEVRNWNGGRSPARYSTWAEAVEYIGSNDFSMTLDNVREVTIRFLAPRVDPETAAREAALEERAQREHLCPACRAEPGTPCSSVEAGHSVHSLRAKAARKAAEGEAR